MFFYLIDDHPQVLRILENIIESANLGEVIGTQTDSEQALSEVFRYRPDIVIIDFLMEGMDGPHLVKAIKEKLPLCQCIMLSQVSAKHLVEKAYEAGVSFYITKPINQIEVTRVIRLVLEQVEMSKKLAALKDLLGSETAHKPAHHFNHNEEISQVLSRIGVLGESGADDLIKICQYYLDQKKSTNQIRVNDVCAKLSDHPKAMEQRIRRAINKGLANLAHLGLEDYMNDTFVKYASSLYDFESVRMEMDLLRGRKGPGGKINVKKFMDNLLLAVEGK